MSVGRELVGNYQIHERASYVDPDLAASRVILLDLCSVKAQCACRNWRFPPYVSQISRYGVGRDEADGFKAHSYEVRYRGPAACTIANNPTEIRMMPMARPMRSPAGERRSAVTAAVTAAIARRSITPKTRRIAVRLEQQ